VHLLVNGRRMEWPAGTTVAGLLDHLGIVRERVAVQLNLEILAKDRWEAYALKDGDCVEIVQMVGGG